MPEREKFDQSQRDVTEQFLSMSSSEFMDFLQGSESNTVQARFDQMDDLRRMQLKILLGRRRFTKVVIEATEEQFRSNPEFFDSKGIDWQKIE